MSPKKKITGFLNLNSPEVIELKARIQNYLLVGGLFNPESMEHDKVQKLILDLRDILS